MVDDLTLGINYNPLSDNLQELGFVFFLESQIKMGNLGHQGEGYFHVIPRMADLPENRRGALIFGYLGVPEEERVSQDVMNATAAKVRERLQVT